MSSEPRYTGRGEWVVAHFPGTGSVSGRLVKHRRRWWFIGDVCRDEKIRVSTLIRIGGSIQKP